MRASTSSVGNPCHGAEDSMSLVWASVSNIAGTAAGLNSGKMTTPSAFFTIWPASDVPDRGMPQTTTGLVGAMTSTRSR